MSSKIKTTRKSLRLLYKDYEKNVKIFDIKDVEIEPKYKVNIDFDKAQKAWRKNKINIGNCYFEYK